MFALVRDPLLRLLRSPLGPPEVPGLDPTNADGVQIFRASPKFMTYRLIGVWIGLGVLAVAFVVAALAILLSGKLPALIGLVLVGGAALAILACVYVGVRIDYEVRYYVITRRSLRVREGAWTVREMTISFANVQNLRVTQGPLQRVFGISDLCVDTAGGGRATPETRGQHTHSLKVAGVENAAELRDLVREHLRRRGEALGAGLGDPDDADDAEAELERSADPAERLAGPAVREALQEVLEAARVLRRTAEGAR